MKISVESLRHSVPLPLRNPNIRSCLRYHRSSTFRRTGCASVDFGTGRGVLVDAIVSSSLLPFIQVPLVT